MINLVAIQEKYQGLTKKYGKLYLEAVAKALGYEFIDWYEGHGNTATCAVKLPMITKQFKTKREAGEWLEKTVTDRNTFTN